MTAMKNNGVKDTAAPSRGRFINTGNGPTFQAIDIGHPEYMAVIDPDTAFWSLVKRKKLAYVLSGGDVPKAYAKKPNNLRER